MEEKTALKTSLVEEFVAKAHTDLARVKEMLVQEPNLVNATWDWGDGDFETALGAAAHMGEKDIANYLLDHGARLDLFTAAMLGKLEIVKVILGTYPGAKDIPGPHGISLMEHAQAGGEEARAVARFLSSFK